MTKGGSFPPNQSECPTAEALSGFRSAYLLSFPGKILLSRDAKTHLASVAPPSYEDYHLGYGLEVPRGVLLMLSGYFPPPSFQLGGRVIPL